VDDQRYSAQRSSDQAAGLRRMFNPRPVNVIAVTSGKGGVGKSSISVNLSVGLAQAGHDVMLLDADLGLANVDVLLNLSAQHNLSHVLDGSCELQDIILDGPAGVKVIPASSGTQHMAELSPEENAGIIRAFSELSTPVDTLIVDTAAGLSDSVISFTRAAREVIVVVCDEPASITDAYATIKVLSRDYGLERFHVVANQAESAQHGRQLYNKLLRVTDRFLDVTLAFLGVVPFDGYMQRAVRRQRVVIEAYPRSRAALAFRKLVQKIDKWPPPAGAQGHLEFFVERLIRYSATNGWV